MKLKKGLCNLCQGFIKDTLLENKALPVWYDSTGNVQYEAPEELTCLTIAEKMLIQLASVVVPLRHVKNGIFGITGHVCSFEQDVNQSGDTIHATLVMPKLVEKGSQKEGSPPLSALAARPPPQFDREYPIYFPSCGICCEIGDHPRPSSWIVRGG